MGAILGWIARVIATGERVAGRDRETPATGPAALASWYSTHLPCTLDVLTATPADSPAWTFSRAAASGALAGGDGGWPWNWPSTGGMPSTPPGSVAPRRPAPAPSPTTSRQAFRKLSITSREELARIVIEQAADGASQRN